MAALTQEITIPGSGQKVNVEVELIPANQLPDALKSSTNISKVTVGGQEFYAVLGKTTTS